MANQRWRPPPSIRRSTSDPADTPAAATPEVIHGHHDRTRHHDQRGDRPPHDGAHLLLVVGPGRRRSDRHRPRRGRLPLHAGGPADPRLQQPADVGQHRPRRPAGRRRHHRPGDEARSTSSRPSRPRSGPASGAKLAEILPGDMDKVFFTLGGAEAIENAIKLARHCTGRHKILARYRSYHGATLGAMTLTGDPRRWAERARPRRRRPLPGHAPLGRGGTASRRPRASRASRTSSATRAPSTIAAVFLETIVGHERHPHPARRLHRRASARSATAHDILMVADEVMAGFGRTGRWFAIDHWDVVPDLMTMAKGLTSSYLPLGAVAMRQHIAEAFETEDVLRRADLLVATRSRWPPRWRRSRSTRRTG